MRNMTRTLTTMCVTHLLPKQLTYCPQKANISQSRVRELIVLAVYIDTGEISGIQMNNLKTSDPICVSLHKMPSDFDFFLWTHVFKRHLTESHCLDKVSKSMNKKPCVGQGLC